MSNFRFRAAAALELRQKQEDAAAIARSTAIAALSEARERWEQADRGRRDAQALQMDRQRHGTDVAAIDWHRNWITRLTALGEQLKTAIDARALALQQADRAWRDARRRRLTLERMRERALRRFQHEQQRRELAVINELATLRHGAPDMWRDDS
jgi:flagellar export protein FliJ